MYKCYSVISSFPNVAKLVERKFHYETYDAVDSVVDKTKFIPESQVLMSVGSVDTNAVYDPPSTTLDTPVPLSRTRGLDPAVLSTHIHNEQKGIDSKISKAKAAKAADDAVQAQLNAIAKGEA